MSNYVCFAVVDMCYNIDGKEFIVTRISCGKLSKKSKSNGDFYYSKLDSFKLHRRLVSFPPPLNTRLRLLFDEKGVVVDYSECEDDEE